MRLLARLSRILISIPGTSSQSLVLPRNLSSQPSEQHENRDGEFVEKLKPLLPSETFKKSLNGLQTKQLQQILPELELYVYMSDRIPLNIDDEQWASLLQQESVKERVGYLEHLALKNRRQEREKTKKNAKSEEYKKWLAEQQDKYDRGEMGYGTGIYTLMLNPMRNQKRLNLVEGARLWCAYRMRRPKLIFDMQHIMEESKRNQTVIGRQMSYTITGNFESRSPIQLAFVNLPKNEKDKLWIKNVVGQYGGEYMHQRVLPDLTEQGVKAVTRGAKEVVYISRHATEFLDGPLTADAYVVCCSMDYKKESLGAARRANIRTVKLPIQRYIKWESGPMYVPFPNIARILREVYVNGGDWKSALEHNIARRHLMGAEERETMQSQVSRNKLRIRNREELIQSLRDATGNA